MTRDEFLQWAIPRYAAWPHEHPGVTPSVDRIVTPGHYSIDNIRILSLDENRRGARTVRHRHAPPGTGWCSRCRDYLPVDQFYKRRKPSVSPSGLAGYCIECTRVKNAEYNAIRPSRGKKAV